MTHLVWFVARSNSVKLTMRCYSATELVGLMLVTGTIYSICRGSFWFYMKKEETLFRFFQWLLLVVIPKPFRNILSCEWCYVLELAFPFRFRFVFCKMKSSTLVVLSGESFCFYLQFQSLSRPPTWTITSSVLMLLCYIEGLNLLDRLKE